MNLPTSQGELLLLSNARCSKSRATTELLSRRGARVGERHYLEQPLDLAELRELGRRLGQPPGDWIRSKEGAYAELGLGPSSSDEELLRAIARRPELLERPILVSAERARIGRPPEQVLELLD